MLKKKDIWGKKEGLEIKKNNQKYKFIKRLNILRLERRIKEILWYCS